MIENWLDFIVDCRNGKEHGYDIVIGAMEDDQVYNYNSSMYYENPDYLYECYKE